jgi:hypothetical protein
MGFVTPARRSVILSLETATPAYEAPPARMARVVSIRPWPNPSALATPIKGVGVTSLQARACYA